jgi:hypothetical protein
MKVFPSYPWRHDAQAGAECAHCQFRFDAGDTFIDVDGGPFCSVRCLEDSESAERRGAVKRIAKRLGPGLAPVSAAPVGTAAVSSSARRQGELFA